MIVMLRIPRHDGLPNNSAAGILMSCCQPCMEHSTSNPRAIEYVKAPAKSMSQDQDGLPHQPPAMILLAMSASSGFKECKEIGSQTGVPRRQGLCQLCGADYGDEMHLVFECHGLAELRDQFASSFQERQTMQQFMWQPDMLQVSKFLDAGVKRMQEIDPDAGSNI